MTTHDFDYVIVGAGSAGCVLAERLSASRRDRVLVLEAGASDRCTEVQIPAAFTKLFKTERDWEYTSSPQRGLSERELYLPRGKMLGGSSSMNAQMWVRGHRADYDAWEELGARGWNWESALAAFRRIERREDGPPGLYGADGPLYVERQRDPSETTPCFLAACESLGIRKLADPNMPDNEGCAQTVVTQRRGRRWSAADAFLHPALERPNLTVVTRARARRVVFEQSRAVGVEYQTATGTHFARARYEVLLAGGTFNSPQLLMLSGVGPKDHLLEHGISVVADRPEVGANLHDHLICPVLYHSRESNTLVGAESPANLLKYLLLRRGMLTSCVGEATAFVRTRTGLSAPDVELIWAPVPYLDHGLTPPPGHGLTIGVVLLQPESRGEVRLRSADPDSAPIVDPAMLTDARGQDLATLVAGVRRAHEIARAPALARHVGAAMAPTPATAAPSEEELARYVREQSFAFYHPVGTCRMGADARAVVDPELRVNGVQGLRVVDASIMPRINRGHTNAPTLMIAQRAAEMIASARRGASARPMAAVA